jgi:protein involved in polysaccharide export with SLBB domain
MAIRQGKCIVKKNRVVFWFLLCALFFLASLARAQQISPVPTPEAPQSEENLVHLGDVIDVDVLGGFEYDWRGTITPDGYLNALSFGDPIYALCRSETALAADITEVFGKSLRDPKIVVKIIDRSNRAVVRLIGAVRTPTRFRLQREVRLGELIVLAGGFTDDASSEITVYRPRNLSCFSGVLSNREGSEKPSDPPRENSSQTVTIKISDLLKGDAKANMPILSGDLIEVVQAVPVYVIGAVNNPRPVYSRQEITVSRAVASAGGLAKDADGGKVSIFRRSETDTKIIDADLGKIKDGESVDEVLKPFDIIDVASRGGGKRRFPPTAANEEKTRMGRELPLRVVD